MNHQVFVAIVFVVVFAGGAIGLALQHSLPEKYTTGGPRDMIGGVVGLLTLLSALVLGLLIWTAYGVYSGQNLAVQNIATQILQLDLALADYGPETDGERARMKQNLANEIDEVWGGKAGDAESIARDFAAPIENMGAREAYLDSLHPSTDKQKQGLAAARQIVASIGHARLQMSFALTDPVSYPLVLFVVGWVTSIFCGFGLMSRGNGMAILAMAVGAVAISSAIYLILDLSSPYSGVFRTSSAPIEQVLGYLGKR
jgi:hypothetical protein